MTKGRFSIRETAAALRPSEKQVRTRINRRLRPKNGHFLGSTAEAVLEEGIVWTNPSMPRGYQGCCGG